MDILKLLLEDMEVRDILKSLLEVMVGRGVMTLEAIKQKDTDSKVMEHPEVKDSEVTPILDMVEASLMASKDIREQESRTVSEVRLTSAATEELKWDTVSRDTQEQENLMDSEATPISDMAEASLMASKDTQEQENRMVSEVTPTSAKEEETKDIPSEVMISAVVILWAVGMMLAMAMLHLFHRWVLTDNNGKQYTVNKSTDQCC